MLDLNEVASTGYGYQAKAGLTGMGLPSVTVQWLEGAGDGARYRGQRVLPRDLDLPLYILGRNRQHLESLISRLARAVASACSLVAIDEVGVRWSTTVVRTGGGDVQLDGGDDVETTITFRSPDPYFTAENVSMQGIGGKRTARPFLSSLVAMPLQASQAIGDIQLDNVGDADAYPVWEVHGPGRDLILRSPVRQSLHGAPVRDTLRWEGNLGLSEKLIVDTRAGTVTDGAGVNRYPELAAAPRFWTVPPGTSTVHASLLDTTADSRIVCSWRPRKWMVV
ncbi:phage tail family protein [Streptomyces olivoreticuli]